ncbi:MAG: ABC transporter substrate-binding protein [Geminicoccaceae bacterium]
MEKISIQFTLFSAFYSPLIATMAGGFLKKEGLEASWSVAPPGISAIKALEDGDADVIQTAPSQAFGTLAKGETPTAVHFAQINEMDGFFVTGREPDPDFSWKKLEGAEVVLFGGGQPRAMFDYACHKAGIDAGKIKAIVVGGAADMGKAFRDGQGAYIQQQGPFPQQLEADGVGHILAKVGPLIGPCAFSSLAAKRAWLGSDMAGAFMRAYRQTRVYMNEASAGEIASSQASYFPKIDRDVLAACIGTYQKLGCWTPHVEITPGAFEVTLDVFEHVARLKERYRYDQVCALPPGPG